MISYALVLEVSLSPINSVKYHRTASKNQWQTLGYFLSSLQQGYQKLGQQDLIGTWQEFVIARLMEIALEIDRSANEWKRIDPVGHQIFTFISSFGTDFTLLSHSLSCYFHVSFVFISHYFLVIFTLLSCYF